MSARSSAILDRGAAKSKNGALLRQMLACCQINCNTLCYQTAANNFFCLFLVWGFFVCSLKGQNKRNSIRSFFHDWRKKTSENKTISRILQQWLWTILKFLSQSFAFVNLIWKDPWGHLNVNQTGIKKYSYRVSNKFLMIYCYSTIHSKVVCKYSPSYRPLSWQLSAANQSIKWDKFKSMRWFTYVNFALLNFRVYVSITECTFRNSALKWTHFKQFFQ